MDTNEYHRHQPVGPPFTGPTLPCSHDDVDCGHPEKHTFYRCRCGAVACKCPRRTRLAWWNAPLDLAQKQAHNHGSTQTQTVTEVAE